ncbi:hypothetical protein C8F04DRAFT_1324529 [Mycena alexandri]|uniref:Uncharacterized protein n=1 Tax=Mycena alexandri TaxID=1745969 RepID=A0AAD6X8B6_9AGAR|nr:hypothetical protein C8F04DRAFT_1324529 [Mycena alexandri]
MAERHSQSVLVLHRDIPTRQHANTARHGVTRLFPGAQCGVHRQSGREFQVNNSVQRGRDINRVENSRKTDEQCCQQALEREPALTNCSKDDPKTSEKGIEKDTRVACIAQRKLEMAGRKKEGGRLQKAYIYVRDTTMSTATTRFRLRWLDDLPAARAWLSKEEATNKSGRTVLVLGNGKESNGTKAISYCHPREQRHVLRPDPNLDPSESYAAHDSTATVARWWHEKKEHGPIDPTTEHRSELPCFLTTTRSTRPIRGFSSSIQPLSLPHFGVHLLVDDLQIRSLAHLKLRFYRISLRLAVNSPNPNATLDKISWGKFCRKRSWAVPVLLNCQCQLKRNTGTAMVNSLNILWCTVRDGFLPANFRLPHSPRLTSGPFSCPGPELASGSCRGHPALLLCRRDNHGFSDPAPKSGRRRVGRRRQRRTSGHEHWIREIPHFKMNPDWKSPAEKTFQTILPSDSVTEAVVLKLLRVGLLASPPYMTSEVAHKLLDVAIDRMRWPAEAKAIHYAYPEGNIKTLPAEMFQGRHITNQYAWSHLDNNSTRIATFAQLARSTKFRELATSTRDMPDGQIQAAYSWAQYISINDSDPLVTILEVIPTLEEISQAAVQGLTDSSSSPRSSPRFRLCALVVRRQPSFPVRSAGTSSSGIWIQAKDGGISLPFPFRPAPKNHSFVRGPQVKNTSMDNGFLAISPFPALYAELTHTAPDAHPLRRTTHSTARAPSYYVLRRTGYELSASPDGRARVQNFRLTDSFLVVRAKAADRDANSPHELCTTNATACRIVREAHLIPDGQYGGLTLRPGGAASADTSEATFTLAVRGAFGGAASGERDDEARRVVFPTGFASHIPEFPISAVCDANLPDYITGWKTVSAIIHRIISVLDSMGAIAYAASLFPVLISLSFRIPCPRLIQEAARATVIPASAAMRMRPATSLRTLSEFGIWIRRPIPHDPRIFADFSPLVLNVPLRQVVPNFKCGLFSARLRGSPSLSTGGDFCIQNFAVRFRPKRKQRDQCAGKSTSVRFGPGDICIDWSLTNPGSRRRIGLKELKDWTRRTRRTSRRIVGVVGSGFGINSSEDRVCKSTSKKNLTKEKYRTQSTRVHLRSVNRERSMSADFPFDSGWGYGAGGNRVLALRVEWGMQGVLFKEHAEFRAKAYTKTIPASGLGSRMYEQEIRKCDARGLRSQVIRKSRTGRKKDFRARTVFSADNFRGLKQDFATVLASRVVVPDEEGSKAPKTHPELFVDPEGRSARIEGVPIHQEETTREVSTVEGLGSRKKRPSDDGTMDGYAGSWWLSSLLSCPPAASALRLPGSLRLNTLLANLRFDWFAAPSSLRPFSVILPPSRRANWVLGQRLSRTQSRATLTHNPLRSSLLVLRSWKRWTSVECRKIYALLACYVLSSAACLLRRQTTPLRTDRIALPRVAHARRLRFGPSRLGNICSIRSTLRALREESGEMEVVLMARRHLSPDTQLLWLFSTSASPVAHHLRRVAKIHSYRYHAIIPTQLRCRPRRTISLEILPRAAASFRASPRRHSPSFALRRKIACGSGGPIARCTRDLRHHGHLQAVIGPPRYPQLFSSSILRGTLALKRYCGHHSGLGSDKNRSSKMTVDRPVYLCAMPVSSVGRRGFEPSEGVVTQLNQGRSNRYEIEFSLCLTLTENILSSGVLIRLVHREGDVDPKLDARKFQLFINGAPSQMKPSLRRSLALAPLTRIGFVCGKVGFKSLRRVERKEK